MSQERKNYSELLGSPSNPVILIQSSGHIPFLDTSYIVTFHPYENGQLHSHQINQLTLASQQNGGQEGQNWKKF